MKLKNKFSVGEGTTERIQGGRIERGVGITSLVKQYQT